jgi:hypothetical protein
MSAATGPVYGFATAGLVPLLLLVPLSVSTPHLSARSCDSLPLTERSVAALQPLPSRGRPCLSRVHVLAMKGPLQPMSLLAAEESMRECHDASARM